MTRAVAERRAILRLPEPVLRVLHWVALVWALLAIAGVVIATQFDWLRYQPGGDAYVIREQQAFGVGFVAAVLLSLRWKVVGGTVAGMTAAGLLVFAYRQLEPIDAAAIVVGFTVPGVLWVLIDLSVLRPRLAVVALALIAVALAAGATLADRVYDDLFGPSHPESSLEALPDSAVEWIWSGAVTRSSAMVTAKVDNGVGSVRLAVSTGKSMHDPRWVEPEQLDPRGVARFVVDSLAPGTEYHYVVEADGALDTVRAGSFATFPDGAASFEIAVGSCARVGTNGAVFDAIRALDPDLFLIVGDFHYANIDDDDPGKFRDVLDLQLSRTAPSALLRSAPVAYVWDDHDFGSNNADSTTASRPAAMQVYREYVPHYGLAADDSPVYQAFTIGRARVIVTDTRSGRSPASQADDAQKTMLGEDQKAWLKMQLREANGRWPLILWVNSVPWISEPTPGGDDWGGYTSERAELANFIADEQISGLLMVSGDAHMVAIDDGTNADHSTSQTGGFPVLHAAALDRPGHTKGGPYSHGEVPGGGQFGLVSVTDDGGDAITVVLSGHDWAGTELLSYTYTIDVVE